MNVTSATKATRETGAMRESHKPAKVASAGHSRGAAEGRRVLVLGGSSEIALAIVRGLQARAPREVALVGRDQAALGRAAETLRACGCARVSTLELDALETGRHEQVVTEAIVRLGGVDIAIVAVGVLGERGALPDEHADGVRTLQVNFVGAGSLLLCVAGHMRAQGHGSIVVLSSVAAERPRRANAVYGASKAGLDALAQGLGDKLHDHGVQVLVVRPGFVRTRMTSGLAPAPLATTPEAVSSVVLAGLDRGLRAHTVWAPPALRWPMAVLKLLPRPLFRRLRQ